MSHMAGFLVDSMLIVATALILTKRSSAAGYVLLTNFIVLHTFIYFVLTQLSFWQIFFFDYHLYLALIGLLVFAAINLVTKDHQLLKLFIALEVALHLVMIFAGLVYTKGYIDTSFSVIYDSYPVARILIASFQIVGLVANVDTNNRGGRNIHHCWRSRLRHITDHFVRRNSRISRVEGL